jgi:S1-C subfamily serine protease
MTIKDISHKIVKIFPQEANINWSLPYQLEQPNVTMGTGFFIDKNGYILTAAHVIAHAASVTIQIPAEGDKRFGAKICGFCPDLDLALLKVEGYINKHHCLLAEGDIVVPGDRVYAIGFPLGQTNIKITEGIVSGRQFGMLQTDTPINPGNSGGPLFKENYVIGINSMIMAMTNNIGYAVPISLYFLIKKELFNNTKILMRRPFIGFEYNDVTPSTILLTKSKCKTGIYISKVFDNSPAFKAGLREGYILCKIGKYNLDNNGLTNITWFDEKMSVDDIFYTVKNNEAIIIKYWTGKKLVTSKILFSPFELPVDMKYPLYENVKYCVFGGLVVMNLSLNHITKNKSLIEYIKPSKRTKPKLLITHVYSGTTISDTNIFQAGNFITHVNGMKVSNVDEYMRELQNPIKLNGDYVLTLQNNENKMIALSLESTLKNEVNLINIYNYPPSTVFQYLMKRYGNK